MLFERAKTRQREENRPDDAIEIVKKRIKTYNEERKPIEALFESLGLLTNIEIEAKPDFELSKESVFEKILELTNDK